MTSLGMSNDEWHLREFSEVLNFTASPPRENVLCIFLPLGAVWIYSTMNCLLLDLRKAMVGNSATLGVNMSVIW